jgi:hypothetical protein
VEKEGEVVFDGELHRDTYDHLVGTHRNTIPSFDILVALVEP